MLKDIIESDRKYDRIFPWQREPSDIKVDFIWACTLYAKFGKSFVFGYGSPEWMGFTEAPISEENQKRFKHIPYRLTLPTIGLTGSFFAIAKYREKEDNFITEKVMVWPYPGYWNDNLLMHVRTKMGIVKPNESE